VIWRARQGSNPRPPSQIAGHEVVCSVILPQLEHPFSREGVERHFEHGTDFGIHVDPKTACRQVA